MLLPNRSRSGKDRELDVMLAKADVTGSLAHLEMLHAIGLVSDEEHGQLRMALVNIHEQVERGEFVIEEGIEDVHSQVELMLVRECGDAGKKIHTGRSRNDQVLLDLKLFSREALFEILENMERLFMLLIQPGGGKPGYTIAGIHSFAGSDALVVRVMVQCLCRIAGR